MSTLSIAYIRSPAADAFWFLLLPPLAIAIALLSDAYLSFAALASINLWITVPHHFATWCRTYGLREDWLAFHSRLILGPIVIILAVVSGFMWAPLTIFLVTALWDHQHSVMQQFGLSRIYDFKGKSGARQAGRLDLWLNVALYANMLVTTPLWTEIWVQQLYAWRMPVDAATVRAIHACSYTATGLVVLFYIVHLARVIAQGGVINPMKYAFLISSYSLWYFTAWHTNSLLVYGIAHKMMHGLQYLVFVYWFLERKEKISGARPWMLPTMSGWSFALVGLCYALLLQLLILRPLDEFGFGVFTWDSAATPAARSYSPGGTLSPYDLYAATIISSTSLIHYYFDSFIWKIRDAKTQQGL